METCYYCKGELKNDVTTLHRQKKGEHFFFENVPVQICTQCGEKVFDGRDIKIIEEIMKNKKQADREITVPVYSFKVA
jgi:YgiT-type zinc finger domain-containing protein